ncbi:hypothetical protein CCH79_00014158 [Gambusia affinis]|uniref:Protein kinase domain-containing protein n=1 Tax=Gambusia affinis TaxID=33528 RepID=A0A315WC32_GAMAF|nr:hypothetical protein CCH79_00014158 [Gambusia affinis]
MKAPDGMGMVVATADIQNCILTFHVGLKPCLLPAVIAMLVAVTMATMSVLCPLMAMMMMMISMFLDLPLRQQACGLPSARSTLVLLRTHAMDDIQIIQHSLMTHCMQAMRVLGGMMTTNYTDISPCDPADRLCITREFQLGVIVVPALLVSLTVITLFIIFILLCCNQRKRTRVRTPIRYHTHQHTTNQRHKQQNHHHHNNNNRHPHHRNHLQGIDENATTREKQHFLGFASFLGGLGPHPFIPAVLGVVSVRSPLVIVLEELRHRDLLGFLWKCREDNASHEMTEKRIFTMAGQVASALDYLHSKGSIHGNIGARSVLVGGDMTAKLWGLGSAYHRTQVDTAGLVQEMELKKWQAPEVLARRTASNSSDVWSFGILLYEMVTLGDPPFAHIMSTELLQYLQRRKTVKRPTNCSNTLYSMMKSCCSWSPQGRPSVTRLIRMLHEGEQSANGSTALRVPEPLNVERYMREAGYGEAFNYAVF